jgi:hypothetical protein
VTTSLDQPEPYVPQPDPRPLFDAAAGEPPPRDAIEFYLEPLPMTLSALYADCLEDPASRHVVESIEAAWAAAAQTARATLAEHIYVKVGIHHQRRGMNSVGKFWPARLRIGHIAHRQTLDYTGNVQLHDHFYVAPTAYPDTSMPTHMPLFVGDANQMWPIDQYGFRDNLVPMLNALYQDTIIRELDHRLNRPRWVRPGPGQEWSLHGYQDADQHYPRKVCAGPARAAVERPRTERQLIEETLAAEPDASEERKWEIRAGIGLPRPTPVQRLVVQDILNPPPPDADEDDGQALTGW